MHFEFTSHAWEEFQYWIGNDQEVVKKIKELLKAIRKSPYKGIGKPEPLKFRLKGYWSRRIDDEHRLVYKIQGQKGVDQKIIVVQCHFHYDDQ